MSQYTATFRTSYSNTTLFANEIVGDVVIAPSTTSQRILMGTSSTGAKSMFQVESNQALVNGLLGAVAVNANTVTSGGLFLTLGDGATPIVGQAPLLDLLAGATMLDTGSSNTIAAPTTLTQTLDIVNSSNAPNALTVSGGIQTTGDITSTSDSRLKTDIQRIPGALGKVLALEGYTYRMASAAPAAPRHMGLLAQEVQAVAPELVGEDKNGYLSVAYPNVTALLVGAIKELHALVMAPQ